MSNIFFISGPCGCGKTTFTDAYAKHMVRNEKKKQVYVIHGDDFHQGFVLQSYEVENFWEDGQAADQIEWLEILKFNWECILEVAAKALKRDIDVLIDYVCEEEMHLLRKLAIEHNAKLYYVVLTASEDSIIERVKTRGDVEMTERALFLKKELEGMAENQGHLYDNTNKTIDEEILDISSNIETYLVDLTGGYPSKKEAERILKEAESCNPGPWGNHSRTAAHCAEAIASRSGMNSEKAYVLGLLHDIGRKFGKRHLGHVSDGYSYMMSMGYEDAARICLTHSFNEKDISKYIGNFDTSEEETKLIKDRLEAVELDDYDRLIQLCDSISGAEGVMDQIDRMTDVKNRYGDYDQGKWDANIKLREYFEDKMGEDLYVAVDKDNFKLG